MRSRLSAALCFCALMAASGCGKPTLYPIQGKVTLGGKGYERLIVYFRPVSGVVNEYNLGVGETDKDGTLKMRSTAGMGLAAGEYKVTFTYLKTKSGKVVSGADEKPDDFGSVVTIEMVPDEYSDRKAAETTPVRFTVKPGGENTFNFDIPVKK